MKEYYKLKRALLPQLFCQHLEEWEKRPTNLKHKRVAHVISIKKNEIYSNIINHTRTRFRFCALKCILTCIRGVCGKYAKKNETTLISDLTYNLIRIDD